MTPEEFVALVAKLVAGLQVPVSMPGGRARLGAAYEPWSKLLNEANHGFGWTNMEACEAAFAKILLSSEAAMISQILQQESNGKDTT